MKISENLTDAELMAELGRRTTGQRINLNLTQSDLAADAGVSKRTVERLESGKSIQLVNFIRILRSLKLMGKMEIFIPAAKASPMTLLESEGKNRYRVRAKKKIKQPWRWGDEK